MEILQELINAVNAAEPFDDWRIHRNEAGKWEAANEWSQVTVDSEEEWSLFKRNGIHLAFGAGGRRGKTRVLVAQLDGVRVYLRRMLDGKIEILVTKEDLYP